MTIAEQRTIARRAVADLTAHHYNERIYGDGADDELVESVRSHGVLNPLLVTEKNVVISGHRRLDAARRVGLATVPVVVFGSADGWDILEALLESNRQRVKTNEQKGREYEASKQIEAERAKQRQREAGGAHLAKPEAPLGEIFSQAPRTPWRTPASIPMQPRAPRAGDIAAQRIGVSRPTAERAAKVVTAIDSLKDEGKEKEAERLRTTLNKSVNGAYKAAAEEGLIPQQPPAEVRRVEITGPITLPTWQGWAPEDRAAALLRPHSKAAKFNSQETDNIEWARWSWNPITGCKHDCSYCYARDIALRFYEQGFVPSFLPERLSAPRNTPVPQQAVNDVGYRNVFTCSMADLFGRWVPAEWIEAVLDQVRGNPQWNFLFLTKFPLRLQEFDFPANAWVGTSVDAQARIPNVEKAMAKVNAAVKWLSCEPLLQPLQFQRLDLFQWIVIGGASKSTQTPEWRPPRVWVEDLERQARVAGCKVYEKTNLLERLREYPGQPDGDLISVPDAFKMPYLQRDVIAPALYGAETD